METIDIALTVVSLASVPLTIFLVNSRMRGFVYSVVTFWAMLLVGANYHLAFDAEYEGITPGLVIFFGWWPGVIYSGFWLVANVLWSSLVRKNASPPDAES